MVLSPAEHHKGTQRVHPQDVHIIAGDFNKALKIVLPKFHQHVKCSTRGENTLDHVYSNIKHAYLSPTSASQTIFPFCSPQSTPPDAVPGPSQRLSQPGLLMHFPNYRTASSRQTGTYLNTKSCKLSQERYWTISSSASEMWLWTKTFGFSQTRNPGWPARSALSSEPATPISGQVTECTGLSPLLYCLYTYDCSLAHKNNRIVKFADDTIVFGLITKGDEAAYREEVLKLAAWCSENNLALKTKELIVDFRKHSTVLAPPLHQRRVCGEGPHLPVSWRPHLRWHVLDRQHHSGRQEGSAAATLPESPQEAQSGLKPAYTVYFSALSLHYLYKLYIFCLQVCTEWGVAFNLIVLVYSDNKDILLKSLEPSQMRIDIS